MPAGDCPRLGQCRCGVSISEPTGLLGRFAKMFVRSPGLAIANGLATAASSFFQAAKPVEKQAKKARTKRKLPIFRFFLLHWPGVLQGHIC
jgi:hypothetical protein